jgi:DNA-binding transcriptional ArsR family regulator
MRRYPDAVPAGEISAALDIKLSTLSVYLNTLVTAGMISKFRQGTWLKYQMRLDVVNGSVAFLVQDCCKGRVELCSVPEFDVQKPLNVVFCVLQIRPLSHG